MTARRIILNFEEKVYCNQSKVWYVLDYQATPFVRDIICHVIENIKCGGEWNLFVNDVLAPDWTHSSVICSESDSVKLIRLPTSLPMECSSDIVNSSENVITITDAKPTLAKGAQVKDILKSPPNQIKPPLKINNNFKRKFPDTTPTHKDRYTNRSKIYVSPSLPKTVPVADALKTAVQETLDFSSPPQKKPCGNSINGTSNFNTVTDSFQKAKHFQDRVTSILNGNSKNSKVKSDSDSSSTSSSSNDDSCVKVPKKIKTEAKLVPALSLSLCSATGKIMEKPAPSNSSDTESEPETGVKQPKSSRISPNHQKPEVCTTIVNVSKSDSSDESSEEESDEEKSVVAKPEDKTKVPSQKSDDKSISESSSDSESDMETNDKKNVSSIAKPESKTKEPPQKSNDKSSSENSSDSDSDMETNEKESAPRETVSAKKPCIQKSSDDESSEEESKSDVTSTQPNSETFSQNNLSKDYSKYSNLEGTPRVSDRLAFKMLDLNESYCPVISAYKEGIITSYNSTSQSVVVKLLPQFQNSGPKNGRFEMDNDVDNDLVELSLKQLIEPKLICS